MPITLFQDTFSDPSNVFMLVPLPTHTPEVGTWENIPTTASEKNLTLATSSSPTGPEYVTMSAPLFATPRQRARSAPFQTVTTTDIKLLVTQFMGSYGHSIPIHTLHRAIIGKTIDAPLLMLEMEMYDPVIGSGTQEGAELTLKAYTATTTIAVNVNPYITIPMAGSQSVQTALRYADNTLYMEFNNVVVSTTPMTLPLALGEYRLFLELLPGPNGAYLGGYGINDVLVEQGSIAPISFWDSLVSSYEQRQ